MGARRGPMSFGSLLAIAVVFAVIAAWLILRGNRED